MFEVVKAKWNGGAVVETVVFAAESKMAANEYADDLRKQLSKIDGEGVSLDCYVRDTSKGAERRDRIEYFNSLTEAEKEDVIEVNGKNYAKKMREKFRGQAV